MTIFDLVFLLAVLASLVTLVVAFVLAIRGRLSRALKLLRAYAICALAYLTFSFAISFFKPQRVLQVGSSWCFDDWCLAVTNVVRTQGAAENSYRVDLRIFSQAGRIAQRANGAWIYLIDDRGRRYSPDPDTSAVPLNVLLQPQESVATSRTFHVPNDARNLGLITGHGGPYCGAMGLLVMGDGGCLFHKPTMVRIE